MEIFRIIKENFSDKLIASGSANRWNRNDQFILYAGSSRSLATLELVVHRKSIALAANYKVMVISVADEEALFTTILQKDLPENWRNIAAYPTLQQIGSDWYQQKKSLVLKVPSVVISQEHNYLLNTSHPDFSTKISLARTEDYFWDERLV